MKKTEQQTYVSPVLEIMAINLKAVLLGGSNTMGAGSLYGGLDDEDNDFFNR